MKEGGKRKKKRHSLCVQDKEGTKVCVKVTENMSKRLCVSVCVQE